jgi:hypothetical protein
MTELRRGNRRPESRVGGRKRGKPTVGFEPTTPGLQNQCLRNSTHYDTSTYIHVKSELTPQLTPEIRKQGQIDTFGLPADPAEILAAWPRLPEHIRAAIMALVRTHGRGYDDIRTP